MQRLLLPMFFCIAFAILSSSVAAESVRKLATEPRRGSTINEGRSLTRLDFKFGEIRAWLLQDGNWHIEGAVRHRGILCATYELGIQFGIGGPGCANVDWIGTPAYVTQRRHCNSALIIHVGGDQSLSAADLFDEITYAQRLINCTGRCQ